MTEALLSHNHWGVVCGHCNRFILLHAQEASEKCGMQAGDDSNPISAEPGVFLAWCRNCRKESPFMTSEIVRQEGDKPEEGFRSHPVFKRLRGRKSASKPSGG